MPVISITQTAGIAVLTVDNPPVNALSTVLRQELWDSIEQLEQNDQVAAVVLICAGRTFIAGADVTEFAQPPKPPHLPDLVARIEACRKPWVAAIHGNALGGGFELAMGCHYRIALSNAAVGLPEVTLGVIPGASGTLRAPRLAGIETAVEFITGGKPMRALTALASGLTDRIASGESQEDLLTAAISFATEVAAKPPPIALAERDLPDPGDEFWQLRETEIRKRARGEVAPLCALASVKAGIRRSWDEALAFERKSFLSLRSSDQSAALRSVFFAERAAQNPVALKGVVPLEIARAAVIGGGTMGIGIAAALRESGLPVILVERDEEALARGMAGLRALWDGAVRRSRMSVGQAEARLAGVLPTCDYQALSGSDLVIEAVFEDLSVKRAVFEKLARVCPRSTIFATNTSYLDPHAIFAGIAAPERCIGLHFFSPANVMRLLEIVPCSKSAPETTATAFALARRLGKIPIQAGICDGFIGNRILRRYREAAESLLRDGVSVAQIDLAMRGYGFAMGPFEAQDLGGLDIAFHQREAARTLGSDVPEALADILVKAGRKGQKTLAGWYDYRAGERRPVVSESTAALLAPLVRSGAAREDDEIAAALVAEMAAEGDAILTGGIAGSAREIDLVLIHGYSFPRWRGGPMFATGR